MSSRPLPPSLLKMTRQSEMNQSLVGEESPRTRRRRMAKRCCGRFCNEFWMDYFQDEDNNGMKLDLVESFCADRRKWISSFSKLILWGITVSTYVIGWLRNADTAEFHLAYLTNWALTFAVLYMTLSLLNTWVCNSLGLIKAAWIMYSVAAVYELAVTILFWLLEYDPAKNVMDYYTIMSHGGIAVAVIIEGLIVNHIPVRIKHFSLCFGIGLLYLGWTVIQNLILGYNPNADDDDVALYDVLEWGNDPGKAAIVAVLILFVVLPVLHLLIWAISLPRRRYRQSSESSAWDREPEV